MGSTSKYTLDEGDEEQLSLDGQLVADDRGRVVVRCGVGEGRRPKINDTGLIRFLECPYLHAILLLNRSLI
jgi:hypothetical protein